MKCTDIRRGTGRCAGHPSPWCRASLTALAAEARSDRGHGSPLRRPWLSLRPSFQSGEAVIPEAQALKRSSRFFFNTLVCQKRPGGR